MPAVMSASPVPLPPLAVITANDKAGLIVLITSLLLAFVVLCFSAWVYTRTYINGPWMRDDDLLTAATAICCVQSAVVLYQVSKGFGKAEDLIDKGAMRSIAKIGYVTDLLYILGLFLSKCSMAYLFLRVSPSRGHSLAAWAAMFGSAVWTVMSILLLSIRCLPGHPWSDATTQCPHLLLRWQLVFAFDAATEFVLVAISIYIVAKLQTALKSKVIVVLVFGLRLPIIAMAAIRLHYLTSALHSNDPVLLGAFVAVWTQIELDYGIMAGTLPCLGPFMTPFSTSYQETRTPHVFSEGSADSYKLHSISVASDHQRGNKPVGQGVRTSMRQYPQLDERILRPDQFSHAATVSHGPRLKNDQQSIESMDSQQMIIRKDMEWSIARD